MDPPDVSATLLATVLLSIAYPVWLLAGIGDWWTHRRGRIEETAGVPEALLHVLMLLELATANTAVLLFDLNAAVLSIVAVAVVMHEATVWVDLRYASARRRIGIVEQWFHSLQIVLPWACLVALCVIAHDQAAALAGFGSAAPDWDLRWKTAPLPTGVVAAVVGAGVLFGAMPFAEEFLRCLQARRHRAADDAANWLTTGGSYAEMHYSSLSQINDSNIKKLGLAWYAEVTSLRSASLSRSRAIGWRRSVSPSEA